MVRKIRRSNLSFRPAEAAPGESKAGHYSAAWLNTSQTAIFLGTTAQQVRNLVWQGRLRAHKPFGRLLFSRAELERLIVES